MKNTLFILIVLLIVACNKSPKADIRERVISKIEKEYPTNGGRNIEYSQLDSTNAKLCGYKIMRIYISESDSIKMEIFHFNFAQTKIAKTHEEPIPVGFYKFLTKNGDIFSNNKLSAAVYIISKKSEYDDYINNKIQTLVDQVSDSIACIEATTAKQR